MIKQYLKNKHNQKIGVLVAYAVGKVVKIGYSACNPNDSYNKELGFEIAVARAEKGVYYLPNRYYKEAMIFIERCKRYFKTEQLPEWTEEYATN